MQIVKFDFWDVNFYSYQYSCLNCVRELNLKRDFEILCPVAIDWKVNFKETWDILKLESVLNLLPFN